MYQESLEGLIGRGSARRVEDLPPASVQSSDAGAGAKAMIEGGWMID
jgi:hypothetical protein